LLFIPFSAVFAIALIVSEIAKDLWEIFPEVGTQVSENEPVVFY